jgi:hypothetical protein
MWSRFVLLCVPPFGFAAAIACTPFKADPPGDAGGSPNDSAAIGAVADSGAKCGHREPPARPNIVDAGGGLNLVFAVSQLVSTQGLEDDAGRPLVEDIGFDLDNTCTGEGQGPSCVEPPWATANHTDGRDGIDNAWANASAPQPATPNIPDMLFRVSSYSGEPDDDQVAVSIYVGLGLSPRGDAGDGGSYALWDGKDRVNIMAELLVPSASPSVDEPLYHDDQAYVSGGMLVAHFPKALWSPGVPEVPYDLLPVSGVVLEGLLTRTGDQWELQNAVVDMRIRFNDLLTSFAQLPDTLAPGELVCQKNAAYLTARQTVCPLVDIASIPGPPSAPCDAVSTASMFQAKQVLLGDVLLPAPPLVLNCSPGIDPVNDTCEWRGD